MLIFFGPLEKVQCPFSPGFDAAADATGETSFQEWRCGQRMGIEQENKADLSCKIGTGDASSIGLNTGAPIGKALHR